MAPIAIPGFLNPDGSTWFLSSLIQPRDGKVYRETWDFAAPVRSPSVACGVGGADGVTQGSSPHCD